MRRVVALVGLVGLLGGCDQAPPPRPAPASTMAAPLPPGGDGGLRPLTSRDGDAPFAPGTSLPPGHPPVGGGAPAPGDVDMSQAVSGTITASTKVAGQVPPGASTIFVIVRNAASQQIVAVQKLTAATLPARFTVSGADAMTTDTRFTGPFDVTARVSRRGDAIPGSGDVEGVSRGVQAGASAVAITLDTVRP